MLDKLDSLKIVLMMKLQFNLKMPSFYQISVLNLLRDTMVSKA